MGAKAAGRTVGLLRSKTQGLWPGKGRAGPSLSGRLGWSCPLLLVTPPNCPHAGFSLCRSALARHCGTFWSERSWQSFLPSCLSATLASTV